MNNYLIMYDISNPKRLNKVFKLIKSYGRSLQKSVFHAYINDFQHTELLYKLERIIDKKEDQVLLIKINKANLDRAVTLGLKIEIYNYDKDFFL